MPLCCQTIMSSMVTLSCLLLVILEAGLTMADKCYRSYSFYSHLFDTTRYAASSFECATTTINYKSEYDDVAARYIFLSKVVGGIIGLWVFVSILIIVCFCWRGTNPNHPKRDTRTQSNGQQYQYDARNITSADNTGFSVGPDPKTESSSVCIMSPGTVINSENKPI